MKTIAVMKNKFIKSV